MNDRSANDRPEDLMWASLRELDGEESEPSRVEDSPFSPAAGAEQPRPWYESAADLLAEDDPGPTPFLVADLIVEAAIAAFVGSWKAWKTWVLLDLAIAIVTGEKALGRFAVPKPGPVLVILEESGRDALHRRLAWLMRGRGLERERIADLHFAANRRVRLDDDEWRGRLLDAARSREWRLIAFDPLARVKGAVDENVQREIGPVLDFLRDLRAASGATVAYVHHAGHEGSRHRGSSDLEAYWESKVTIEKKNDGGRVLKAEHREAEAVGPFRLSSGFDATTETVRLRAALDELDERVRAYLDEHPTASANEVAENVEGNRQRKLELVRQYREGGSDSPEPPGTTYAGSDVRGGSSRGAYKAPGTTPADLGTEVVPDGRNHPSRCIQCGAPCEPGSLYCAVDGGRLHSEGEIERLADLARGLEGDG